MKELFTLALLSLLLVIFAFVDSGHRPFLRQSRGPVLVLNQSPNTTFHTPSREPSLLPSPTQNWVHGVDRQSVLMDVLDESSEITAIETDIVMGCCTTCVCESRSNRHPVHAHPPNKHSDLSMKDFLNLVSNYGKNVIQKVIKLDFKTMDVVEPTLQTILDQQLETSSESAIYLNADILPGPGFRRPGAVSILASEFIETCLSYIHRNAAATRTRFAFSLGFKTDCSHNRGYTTEDNQAMTDLLQRYHLLDDSSSNVPVGVVLALNARQLAKNVQVFDPILRQFPELQLLIWTGKGEPAIASTMKQYMQNHFNARGMGHRIGFDVHVTDRQVVGAAGDLALDIGGFFRRVYFRFA